MARVANAIAPFTAFHSLMHEISHYKKRPFHIMLDTPADPFIDSNTSDAKNEHYSNMNKRLHMDQVESGNDVEEKKQEEKKEEEEVTPVLDRKESKEMKPSLPSLPIFQPPRRLLKIVRHPSSSSSSASSSSASSSSASSLSSSSSFSSSSSSFSASSSSSSLAIPDPSNSLSESLNRMSLTTHPQDHYRSPCALVFQWRKWCESKFGARAFTSPTRILSEMEPFLEAMQTEWNIQLEKELEYERSQFYHSKSDECSYIS